jgi:hypothetical protein
MPVPPPTTYRQASVSTDIHKLSIYPHSPPRPVLGLRWANKTHMTMETQAAGRKTTTPYIVPRMPHPGPRCAHTDDTGRSLVQRPHHLTTCRSQVSLSLSAPVVLWLTTKGHAKLLHCCCTPTIQAPHAFAYTCMAVDGHNLPGSPTRRLHAHAAHRVPTPRVDRPPCRPDTGMRPSCTHYEHSRDAG